MNWLDGAKDRDGGRKSKRKIEVAEVAESEFDGLGVLHVFYLCLYVLHVVLLTNKLLKNI